MSCPKYACVVVKSLCELIGAVVEKACEVNVENQLSELLGICF